MAIVTHGYLEGGGVASIAQWMRQQVNESDRYTADVHVLATSRNDVRSRRILDPRSWRTATGPDHDSTSGLTFWGASASEIEFMRYARRRNLTEQLRSYDLVHVIAGAPAWGRPVLGIGPPVVLQIATLSSWEREADGNSASGLRAGWRRSMTKINSSLEAPALRRADAVLVINDVMLHHVRDLGQPEVTNAPPGTDTNTFFPNLEWDPTGYLLSVCRLNDARKGLVRMVEAYAQLVAAYPNAPDLVLAGIGAPSDEVLAAIGRHHLGSRVVVRQNVPLAELPDLYRGASLFLQTSYEEGLGISLIEAMACGIPAIATATAGTSETVANGQTGWLIEQISDADVASDVARKVQQALLDQSTRDIATNARTLAERRFSNAATSARFLEIYDQLLRGRSCLTLGS